jgi:hypothetical protein
MQDRGLRSGRGQNGGQRLIHKVYNGIGIGSQGAMSAQDQNAGQDCFFASETSRVHLAKSQADHSRQELNLQ